MKNCLIRSVFKGLVVVLFLSVSSSLFAISFNEPRKVIIPQYANAVYRDLTVLDKMWFEIQADSNRIFLLELGKRPSYFWDTSKSFYLYQTLFLKFDPGIIAYNGYTENANVLTISDMNIGSGAFASEHTFLNEGSIISINNSSSTLLVNYKGNFPAHLYFGNESHTYKIFASSSTVYSKGGSDVLDVMHKVDNLYLRDAIFNGAKFPSNRVMIHYNGGKYKAQGTATEFQLSTPKPLNSQTKAQSYYAPWQLHNSGILTTASGSPCGETLPDDRCSYRSCTVVQPGQDDEEEGGTRGGCIPVNADTKDSIFYCLNKPYDSSQSGTYDPDGECYDYQEKYVGSSSDATLLYNNNKVYYDFKVEEVYSINENGSAILLSQTPKTKSDGISALSSYNSATDSWSFETSKRNFFINGGTLSNVKPVVLTDSTNDNPCFTVCGGKLCTQNYVYLRDMSRRDLKGGENSADNFWPASDGHKQNLAILTYTLGFCKKNSGTSDNSYANYENNLGTRSELIDALLIKTLDGTTTVAPDETGTWTYSKVCVKRKVHCNLAESDPDLKYNRSYKLLSTDN